MGQNVQQQIKGRPSYINKNFQKQGTHNNITSQIIFDCYTNIEVVRELSYKTQIFFRYSNNFIRSEHFLPLRHEVKFNNKVINLCCSCQSLNLSLSLRDRDRADT